MVKIFSRKFATYHYGAWPLGFPKCNLESTTNLFAMNLKTIFVLLLSPFLSLMAFAAPIDVEQARGVAAKFLKERNSDATLEHETFALTRKRMGMNGAGAEAPVYYVFNAEYDEGYVIVSADDRTDAVLGYATRGRFDSETMPPNVQAWMESYAQQISSLDSYANASQQESDTREAIAPLLTTLWNQDSPYNDQCPLQGSSRTYTGCTATALAQVMKYHEWPSEATTSIPAYTTATAQIYVPELSPTAFRWDDMAADYHYTDYAPAVSELMRYCGQALQSDFTRYSTSAYLADIPSVLTTYFGYDSGAGLLYQSNYPVSAWEDIIYAELQSGRPVLHAGTSLGGGHAFVCDGYDGHGMFHFNWGWGGMYDGYFKLSLLTPGSGGIGAGTADGFTANQRIVVGVQPPTSQPQQPKPFTALNLQQSGTNLYSYFQNPNTSVVTARVGFALVDEQGDILRVLKDCGSMTLKGYNLENNWAGLYLGPYGEVNLSPGTYRIAAVCKMQDDGAWVRAGNTQTYFELEITENGELTNVVLHPITKIEIAGFDCLGSAVVGTNLKVRIIIANRGDDLNSMLYFYVSETDRMPTALTRIPLLLHGGETFTYDVSFFAQHVGKYYMWLSDVDDGVTYLEKRELDVIEAPTQPSDLTLLNLTVDPTETTAVVQVRNNSDEAYYRGIKAYLYEELYGDGNYYYVTSVEQHGAIAPLATETFHFTFDGFSTINPCYISVGYYQQHTDEFATPLGAPCYFQPGTTAIEHVPQTALRHKPTIYRLNGTPVTQPTRKGIYIVDGVKRVGGR